MPDFIFLSLLGFLIIFSCLAFGCVTILPLTLIESIIGMMAIFWLAEMAYKGKMSIKKTGLFVPVLLFLGVIVFQLIPLPFNFIKLISVNTANLYENFMPNRAAISFYSLSIYPDVTISELFKFLAFICLFFLIIHKIETKKQVGIIINLIIFFGLLVSIFGLAQKYADLKSRSFGPFVNRNNFAGYINLIIPLALGYFLTDMPLSKRLVYAFSIGIMTLALFMSASRAGILVYMIILLFILLFSRLNDRLKAKIPTLATWFFITVFLFIFFLNSRVVWERLSTLFNKNTYIVLGHGYSWLDVLRIWKDFPIFGTGLGTFGSISSMYKTTLTQVFYSEAHNDYLQLLSEAGLIGTIFVILFFGLYFRYIINAWLERHNPYVVCLMLGGICSILGMLVYSFLDFNLQIPANALLFFVIMGLVYSLASLETKNAIS